MKFIKFRQSRYVWKSRIREKNIICTTFGFYCVSRSSARTHVAARPNEGDLNIEANEWELRWSPPGTPLYILDSGVERIGHARLLRSPIHHM